MDAWEDDNFFFLGFWPICRSKTGWQIWQVDREVWNFSGSLCFDFMLKHFSWMPLFNLDGINCCIFQIPSKNSETAIHDPLEQKKQSNRLDTSWYTSHRQQGRKLLSCVLFFEHLQQVKCHVRYLATWRIDEVKTTCLFCTGSGGCFFSQSVRLFKHLPSPENASNLKKKVVCGVFRDFFLMFSTHHFRTLWTS